MCKIQLDKVSTVQWWLEVWASPLWFGKGKKTMLEWSQLPRGPESPCARSPFFSPKPKPSWTSSNPLEVAPICLLKSSPLQIFSVSLRYSPWGCAPRYLPGLGYHCCGWYCQVMEGGFGRQSLSCTIWDRCLQSCLCLQETLKPLIIGGTNMA